MNRKEFLIVTIVLIGIILSVIGAGIYFSRHREINAPSLQNSLSATSSINNASNSLQNILITKSTSSMSAGIVFKIDADPNYYNIAKEVVAGYGDGVRLVEMNLTAWPEFSAQKYFFRVTYGPRQEEIIKSGSNLEMHNDVQPDTRQPISLSDWKISAQEALEIASNQIRGLISINPQVYPQYAITMDLLQETGTLVWNIGQTNSIAHSDLKLNAKTGEVISKKTTMAPGQQ